MATKKSKVRKEKKEKKKLEDPKVFFTSDLHLNHANILKYCNRPFKNVEEMDRVIIENFKSTLKEGDTLYILGDLTFKRQYAENFLRIITGMGVEVHFIIGNHDKDGKTLEIIEKYCTDVQEMKEIQIQGIKITMCHYPMYSWNASHYGAWHLFGHVHGRKPFATKQYDVGVDSNDFKPVSFTWLRRVMKHKLVGKKNG